ncbi:MAG: FAD:protein FMN transferase [Verrucomicrobia bacterium]|nr:FAD:protein FMN transferase [Verrucomicrobiota bacterium]
MIHVFKHHAMATEFQVRLATADAGYAAQAARAAFDEADRLENLLSRFRENSDISAIARLLPGEALRLSEPVFACLEIARDMTAATAGAFSVAPTAVKTQGALPRWSLNRENFSVRCEAGRLEFDLGAIGKGFALDRMAEILREWDCPAFLLVAGGSSILAGDAPPATPGWSVGLGDDNAEPRYWLAHASLSGSGVAVKGRHIFDPRTGEPAARLSRAWALAPSAAVSDALSTAGMVLDEAEIKTVVAGCADWLVWLQEKNSWRHFGGRALPPQAG